jgi:tRNA(Arg) A34 adenosine deaminase TadA
MNDDQTFLKTARDEGNKNDLPYNFGAVVVKDGKIISQAHNLTRLLHDPSAHAEVLALRKAGEILGSHNLDGCVLYGSHEPCIMCFMCAAWANIERVVYAVPASTDSNDSYRFTGLSLEDVASKLTRHNVRPELVTIDD